MTQKNTNPWTMDVRVRERNLKSGALTEKDLEKHLAALPDLADQAESFALSQPALAQQPQAIAAPVSAPASDDDLDDDIDDEDDEPVAAAPAESAPEAPVAEESAPGGGDVVSGGEGGEQP